MAAERYVPAPVATEVRLLRPYFIGEMAGNWAEGRPPVHIGTGGGRTAGPSPLQNDVAQFDVVQPGSTNQGMPGQSIEPYCPLPLRRASWNTSSWVAKTPLQHSLQFEGRERPYSLLRSGLQQCSDVGHASTLTLRILGINPNAAAATFSWNTRVQAKATYFTYCNLRNPRPHNGLRR